MRRSSRNTGPSDATRRIVWTRADNCCERCGVSVVNTAAHIHHRSARRMGGTHNPAINRPENLALLCADCHRDVEAHRAHGKATGWIVSSWEAPETVPMSDLFHQRFLFDGERRVDL